MTRKHRNGWRRFEAAFTLYEKLMEKARRGEQIC